MNFRLSLGRCHGWMRENGNSYSARRRTFHDATQSKAVASHLRPGTLAKLSDDAHFAGRILATQIGPSPFTNFRQRLSQSIMGTKQLNVEETD
jgi:hypothetical protein